MDPERFDASLRALGAGASRRRVLASLLGGTLLSRLGLEEAAARCFEAQEPCKSDPQCCSKNCVKNGRCAKNGKPTGKCQCDAADKVETEAGDIYAFLTTLKFPWCAGEVEPRKVSGDWRDHQAQGFALDFTHPDGSDAVKFTRVLAPMAGTVKKIEHNGCTKCYGNHVEIDAGNGWKAILAHLDQFAPNLGTRVSTGDLVGTLGNTGLEDPAAYHIHFELLLNNGSPSRLVSENLGLFVGHRRDDFGNGKTFLSNQRCKGKSASVRIEAAVQDPVNGANIFASQPPAHKTIPAEIRLTGTDNRTFTKGGEVTYDRRRGAFIGVVELGWEVPDGTYSVAVKFRDRVRTLRKQVAGTVKVRQGRTTKVPRVILTPGDANDDNAVNILDYNMIISCYGPTNYASCSENWRRGADLNDDGQVGEVDYNLFLRVVSMQGGAQAARRFPPPSETGTNEHAGDRRKKKGRGS